LFYGGRIAAMAPTSDLSVRVTPRASRDELAGWRDGVLQVRLRAPPSEGRANEALRRLLAERLGLPPSRIEIDAGATARTKRLRIEGLDDAALAHRLGRPAV
jgi:uncharacterized protein (TIGR00251 family)